MYVQKLHHWICWPLTLPTANGFDVHTLSQALAARVSRPLEPGVLGKLKSHVMLEDARLHFSCSGRYDFFWNGDV